MGIVFRRLARELLRDRGHYRNLPNGGLAHVPTDRVGRVSYRLYQHHSMRLLRLWAALAGIMRWQ